MRAIEITEFGGPEVLAVAELPEPRPGPDEVLIEVSRAGVNFADTHTTENSYLSEVVLPIVPGVEAVGQDQHGRRVVAFMPDGGGYAQYAVADTGSVFEVPDDVDDATALAMVVQGASAWMLLRRTAPLRRGDSVVVHAAAGGVGTLAVQLARLWGAGRVIATASTEEKRELALELGADAAVEADAPDMTAALIEANGGDGVDVVLDMTGGRITDESVAALAPFGRLAFYGMASRRMPRPIPPTGLMSRSVTVGGMWLRHAMHEPGLLAEAIDDLFELAGKGDLNVVAGGEYPLTQARRAHEELRARQTVGKLVLDPSY
jgi:NADPH2:quinone reductase